MPRGQKGKHRRSQRKGGLPYTTGQVNALIDDIFHPLKETHWLFILVDEAAHMINEGDLEQSFYKFMKYSFPELLKKLFEKKDR